MMPRTSTSLQLLQSTKPHPCPHFRGFRSSCFRYYESVEGSHCGDPGGHPSCNTYDRLGDGYGGEGVRDRNVVYGSIIYWFFRRKLRIAFLTLITYASLC